MSLRKIELFLYYQIVYSRLKYSKFIWDINRNYMFISQPNNLYTSSTVGTPPPPVLSTTTSPLIKWSGVALSSSKKVGAKKNEGEGVALKMVGEGHWLLTSIFWMFWSNCLQKFKYLSSLIWIFVHLSFIKLLFQINIWNS